MSKKQVLTLVVLSIAVLALAACTSSYSSGAAPAVAPTSAPAGATAGLQVAQNAGLGKFLADQDGRTLYVFLKDTKSVSNCSGGCAATWPPLKTQDKPSGQNGVDGSLLGTIQRDDGSTQVTYNGWPLYYYAPDQALGDTKGQGVGQVWYVVGPDGNPIKSTSSSAPAQAPAQAPAAQPTSPYHY
jgi:predicted lipoprotein with Yx(FWY)xxD motif